MYDRSSIAYSRLYIFGRIETREDIKVREGQKKRFFNATFVKVLPGFM